MTIKAAWTYVRRNLSAVSDVPDVEAQRLLLHVLERTDSSWLIAHDDEELSPAQWVALKALERERASGKPLAYVLGSWDFYGRTFVIDERVLVPRPETEELVERALQWLAKQTKEVTVADIGTGSGVIVITLLKEAGRRGCALRMLATDISSAALEVARINARHHGVEHDITFFQGDMLEPLTDLKVDLIVSNPPYVPTAEISRAERSPETVGLLFEPRIALDGGSDGQHYIQKITASGIPAVIEGLRGEILEVPF